MKINSEAVLITTIFGLIFIFITMGKIPGTYSTGTIDDCDMGPCRDDVPIETEYIRLYGFPVQWSPKPLPYEFTGRFESLNYKGIVVDGFAGVAVGGIISFILFRKRKK